MTHLLLFLFPEFLYVLIRCNVSDCNQVKSSVHYYYDDGVAQGFVVEFGVGLVHITIIGYVNKQP